MIDRLDTEVQLWYQLQQLLLLQAQAIMDSRRDDCGDDWLADWAASCRDD